MIHRGANIPSELFRPETLLVHDFLKRKALRKIGYTSSLGDLDSFEAEAMICCSNKFESLDRAEMESQRKK